MSLLPLEAHHIVDLYVWVDDLLPRPEHPNGRPSILRDSALITILLWNTVILHQKTIRDLHTFARIRLFSDFPHMPSSPAFVDHCHRVTPLMFSLLQSLLCADEPIKIADSTMLEVCKLHRANQHKVAKKIAAFSKNHQGWHYGFKRHTSITLTRTLCAIALTPANVYDAQMMPKILRRTKIAVGDSHYGARVMREYLWETQGTAAASFAEEKNRNPLAEPTTQLAIENRSGLRHLERASASRQFFPTFRLRVPRPLRQDLAWVSDSRSVMRRMRFQDSRIANPPFNRKGGLSRP